MKEGLLSYIDKEVRKLKKIQYVRNQAQALIIEGELSALDKIKKEIEKN